MLRFALFIENQREINSPLVTCTGLCLQPRIFREMLGSGAYLGEGEAGLTMLKQKSALLVWGEYNEKPIPMKQAPADFTPLPYAPSYEQPAPDEAETIQEIIDTMVEI